MKPVRIVTRLVALKVVTLTAMVLMGFSPSRPKNAPMNKRQKAIRQWSFKTIVKIVGVNLTVIGEVPSEDESALWVANHISWLDIPVIGSEGVAFLSKAEIRKWPIIGWIGEKYGTVFIQRGGENASQLAAQKIAEKIKSYDHVLVFPEATISDGEDVKHFHARIFAPAIDHGLRVQPIAIRYLDKEGKPHPSVVWGDESFLSNLIQILGESSVFVELNFLPLLESNGFSERKQLAELAYNQIRDIVKVSI